MLKPPQVPRSFYELYTLDLASENIDMEREVERKCTTFLYNYLDFLREFCVEYARGVTYMIEESVFESPNIYK